MARISKSSDRAEVSEIRACAAMYQAMISVVEVAGQHGVEGAEFKKAFDELATSLQLSKVECVFESSPHNHI